MKWFRDPDDTVVIKPARPPNRPRQLRLLAVACAAMLVACVLVTLELSRPTPQPAGLPSADEAQILAAAPNTTLIYRFAQAPDILVAIFPSLHTQALTLNRAAVFIEMAGISRDHVPDDPAMMQDIAAAHIDFNDFYSGHDYRAADLRRMWQMADRQGLTLLPEEQALRAALTAAATAPGGFGAVISLPPPGEGLQDSAARATILRHELSHGLYFTDPTYAATVTAFWQNTLSEQERIGFRRFLGRGGYDTTNEDLMRNEMQAYLVHTPDRRFFRPGLVGISGAEAARLRALFLTKMSAGWLRAREGF